MVRWRRWPAWAALGVIAMAACSPPVERPKGAAGAYLDAVDMFHRGRYDRALEFTESVAGTSSPSDYTERARVLRVVVLSGEIDGYKELGEAYTKGVEATKNGRYKAEYERLRHDNLEYAAKLALGLGEVAQNLTQGGTISKQLTLEAPYPNVEGPMMIASLDRVKQGGWIESTEQEQAAIDAPRMGVDNVLADVVRGDRFKAQTLMKAGPVKLDGADFGIFLGGEVLSGASLFDKNHMHDPEKFKVLSGIAENVAKATGGLLKDAPDPDKEKRLKKLQDDIKAESKNS
ncbi:MAG TPA: hypothetical protein VKU44_10820 [Terriglobia bacterium]|nr:hypothetical protein [Terriglobia bacterium]